MIHKTAIISKHSEIEDGVEIGPYCIIGDDVRIKTGTVLKSHVVIRGPCTVGKNNIFFQFCSIGEIPQDLKFKGERSIVEIGDNNVFRECVTVNRGTEGGGGITKIGSNNLFMAYCHIAHDCIINNNVVLANSTNLAGHVTIRDWAVVGGFVGVVQFRTIGDHAYIGAMSKVTKDVPPFCIADGMEARLRGVNVIGLKRRGYDSETIREIKRAYDFIFSKKGPIRELVDNYEEELESIYSDFVKKEIRQFLDFIRNSKGVMTP